MFEQIETIFKKQNIFSHKNQGITVANFADSEAGVDLAKSVLYEIVDRKTVLYLSGGSLKGLYEKLAREEIIKPGAVGQVDERFGEPMHPNSNQLMLRESGLLRYLQILDIPFYPVLNPGKSREELAIDYDEKVRSLHATYQKSIGILGIGPDGHTSSIIPNRENFKNPWFGKSQNHLLVSEFNDQKSTYKERVGMTFLGLSMLDMLLILAFGENKKVPLEKMFEDGSEEEIPARFFMRSEISKKTLLITDQRV